MKNPHVPKYCRHSTGQAFVNLPRGNRQYERVYLGVHDTPRSRAKYDQVIARWLQSKRAPRLPGPNEITVASLVADYLSREATKYRELDEKGQMVPTRMMHRVKAALRPVAELFGDEPAAEFGTRAFEETRQRYIETCPRCHESYHHHAKDCPLEGKHRGYTRGYVNSLCNCLRSFLTWAVRQELIPAEKAYAVRMTKNFRPGQTIAPDNEEVKPAPLEHIEAVRQIVSRQIRDMIDLQRLSGARPGEICRLQPSMLDRSGPTWFARPKKHKTAKLGKTRQLWFGPQAQAILRPYLDRPAEEYCFSPQEAELERLSALGQTPRTHAGRRYHVSSYSRAIRKACERLKIPSWHPHQLRHNAATYLIDHFGQEVAKTVLGHATLRMTRHYDDPESQKKLADAEEAIRKVG